MSTIPRLPPGLAYGGDYNPEQWDESVWRDDMRLMRTAGVNFVSIGIFSWAHLEPAPGRYEFGWLDRLMDLLAANGIRANLATGTASPPPWLAVRHPDSLPIGRDGQPWFPGGRQHYSPFSAAYRRHALALVTRLARRYAQHPALAAWHVNNEYACHIQECHGPEAQRAFRAWLRRRHRDLAGLNAAWSTSFWSQRYGAWPEVGTPRRVPAFNNPAQEIDYRRCFNDAVLALYLAERAVLRRATPGVPVSTNFMWPFKALDYRAWAPHLDFACWDAYPDPAAAPEEFAAFGHDLIRSLLPNRPFLLMEQATTQVNWRPLNVLKPPGLMRRLSLQAVARGADGVLFFQWRQSLGGAEKFHSAMVPHGGAGPRSRVWREVAGLGAELLRLRPVAGTRPVPRAALVFDWENWWALELPGKPAPIDYAALMADFHRWFFRRNLPVDFVAPSADLSGYKLVVAPALYLLRAADAANLAAFARDGGQLLATYFSGIVDEHDRVVPGGYPAHLRATLGLCVEEWQPFAAGTGPRVRLPGARRPLRARDWADLCHLEGAQALGTFADGFFAGRPAFTRHRVGRGAAHYLATRLADAGLDRVLAPIATAAGLRPAHPAPAGVEASVRTGARGDFLFLLNHGARSVTVPLDRKWARDLLSGRDVIGQVRIAPGAAAVVTTRQV